MDVSDPSLDKPEEIRTYLKENMAEGYLSEDEGLNIDSFVADYAELLSLKHETQEIIRKVYEDKVR